VAVKSVLSIDVDDTKFKQHLELFGKYQAALAKMPANWKAAAGGAATITKANQGIVALMLTQAQLMTQAIAAQGKAATQAKTTATAWSSVAASTKQVYANLEGAARSMLRLGGLTTIVTGLLGGGALFGLDRMAEGVANIRRSALGLGVSPGEQRAFGLDYGRFLSSPGSSLSAVAGALSDPTSAAYRPIASLLGGNIQGGAADVTQRLLEKLPQLFPGGAGDPTLGPKARAYGLTNIFSIEDIKAYLGAKESERTKIRSAYGQDKGTLNLDPATTLAWQNLDTQLQLASGTIYTVFVKGLTPLTEPLTHLSKSVTQVVATFLKAAEDRHWIDQISAGLEKFAGYIGDPKFDDNVKKFADDISKLASLLGTAVEWLVGAFGDKREKERVDQTHSMGLKTADELREERASGKATVVSQILDIFRGGDRDAGKGVFGNPLTTIATSGGHAVTVSSADAARWKGFLETLEAGGAPITSLGGYNPRKIAGTNVWSEHAYGRAIDIDQSGRDKVTAEFREWVRRHSEMLRQAEQKYGIKSGADFRGRPDLGHFEIQRDKGFHVTVRAPVGSDVNATVVQQGYGGGSAVP
jgi:hypothetical protein